MKTVKSTTTFEIWSRAYLRLKAHSQQLLPLGFFLGVLPALLSFVYLSFAGASALPASLEGVDFSKANQQLADVFQPLTFFFSMYSLVYLGVSFLWFLLYCSVLVFLAEGKNNLVLIEERQLESFKSFAKNLDLNLREISNIEGYNYSKGNNIKIFFYKTIH